MKITECYKAKSAHVHHEGIKDDKMKANKKPTSKKSTGKKNSRPNTNKGKSGTKGKGQGPRKGHEKNHAKPGKSQKSSNSQAAPVKCIDLNSEGKGLVKIGGRVHEVTNLLPGEEASLNRFRHKNGVSFEVNQILKPSKARVKAPCPYYEKCGGCHLQHMSLEAQKSFKEKQVAGLMKNMVKVDSIFSMDHPYAYRNKSHITYGYDGKGQNISGIYAEKSHRIIAMDRCLIHHESADEIAVTIKNMLKSFKLQPFDEDSQRGFLRHVLIRRGHVSGEIMVVLVVGGPVFPSKKNFVKALKKAHPEITTILMNVNSRRTSMVLGDKESVLYGKGYITDTLCGLDFKISAKSFYQINSVQTEKLYGKAIELARLTGKEKVVDAYCGIGTIGLIAAKKAKEVIGIELNKDAVRDAINNAKQNGIKNVRFHQGDAGAFMVDMAKRGEKVDVVLMDPPRSGSDENFLSSVVKLKPKRIVYVSCNPETQARDMKYLINNGYKAKAVQPVDMFPQTYHVETVAELELK